NWTQRPESITTGGTWGQTGRSLFFRNQVRQTGRGPSVPVFPSSLYFCIQGGGLAPVLSTSYGYDTLNRLNSLVFNGQNPGFGFGYDNLRALAHLSFCFLELFIKVAAPPFVIFERWE